MVTTEQIYWLIGVTAWVWLSIFLFIGTFVLYVAIMKMREVQHRIWRLHWPVRWTCYLILFVGLIFDTLLNWIVCTVIFLEFPKEFLTTSRVVRHKYQSTHWRKDLADYFCFHWFVVFDERHCD